MTVVIGHRGASADFPENTLDAFAGAAAQGADWVELDVRATSDGILVVHHDAVLPDGRRFALNLVQPAPCVPGGPSENMLWIDGQPEQIHNASLQVDAMGWRVQADGLQLVMRPIALYRQTLKVPLLRHRLDHHGGAWSGFVETSRGRVELQDVFGLGEDNDSWW